MKLGARHKLAIIVGVAVLVLDLSSLFGGQPSLPVVIVSSAAVLSWCSPGSMPNFALTKRQNSHGGWPNDDFLQAATARMADLDRLRA